MYYGTGLFFVLFATRFAWLHIAFLLFPLAVGEKLMSPYALDCIQDLLTKPMSPPQPSYHERVLVLPRQIHGSRSETVTSATLRSNPDLGVSPPGLTVAPQTPSPLSVSHPSPVAFSSGNGFGSTRNLSGQKDSANLLELPTRTFSLQNVQETVTGSSKSGMKIPTLRLNKTEESTSPVPNFANGKDKQNPLYLSFWNVKQLQLQRQQKQQQQLQQQLQHQQQLHHQQQLQKSQQRRSQSTQSFAQSPKNSQYTMEALEVVVPPAKQNELANSSSLNQSPSDAPSSEPLPSPNFLSNVHQHHFSTPSPDNIASMFPSSSVNSEAEKNYHSANILSSQTHFIPDQFQSAATSSSKEQILSQASSLLMRANLNYTQGLMSASSSSSSSTVNSNFHPLMEAISRVSSSDLQMSLEPHHGLDQSNIDISSIFNITSNGLTSQVREDGGTGLPSWVTDLRDNNLIYKPDLLLSQPINGSFGITGQTTNQPNINSNTEDHVNRVSQSSAQESVNKNETKNANAMTISQLIGGAMKIEPDDWMTYTDPQ